MKERGRKRRAWTKLALLTFVFTLAVLGATVVLVRRQYNHNLQALSASQRSQTFIVPKGSSVKQIGNSLQKENLIRASWAFEWYFRINKLGDRLKAGTYSLRPDMSIKKIASIVTEGTVATDQITILPGKRLDEIRTDLINGGFEVKSVDSALKPDNYRNHPSLVDKPENSSLEGYIFPETFQKTSTTEPQTIIKSSLDELQKVLTPQLRASITKQGLTIHEAIILASIIEKEAGSEPEKPKIAQVFLKRLKMGVKLQSDATAGYGAVLNGDFDKLSVQQILNYESKYNTYLHNGLPPGPISNFNKSSLEAVAYPAQTDYLYFVAGNDCVTRFSKTLEEHENLQTKFGVRSFTTVCK